MNDTEMTKPKQTQKPKYRGVLHQIGFFCFVPLGIWISIAAPNDRARFAVSIYAVCISMMLGTSALFHRRNWTTGARRIMRRMDHSMIFAAVAGTYTPVAMLALHGTTEAVILWLVWGGAALGVIQQLIWIDAPKWATAIVYLSLGWVAVGALPELTTTSGMGALLLLVSGGLLYSIGAAVYAMRKPDPSPTVFGYHEVFHSLVLAAVLTHYLAIFIFIMR